MIPPIALGVGLAGALVARLLIRQRRPLGQGQFEGLPQTYSGLLARRICRIAQAAMESPTTRELAVAGQAFDEAYAEAEATGLQSDVDQLVRYFCPRVREMFAALKESYAKKREPKPTPPPPYRPPFPPVPSVDIPRAPVAPPTFPEYPHLPIPTAAARPAAPGMPTAPTAMAPTGGRFPGFPGLPGGLLPGLAPTGGVSPGFAAPGMPAGAAMTGRFPVVNLRRP